MLFGNYRNNLEIRWVIFFYCKYIKKGFSQNDVLNIGINDKVTILDIIQKENETDIGVKMKKRAINSYGVQDFLQNVELLAKDESENDVKYLWNWFDCKILIYE